MQTVSISVVIPLLNEQDSLLELCQRIDKVLTQQNLRYEIVLVDDGSTDESWKQITAIHQKNPQNVKAIRFLRNYGKAAALMVGFKNSIGDAIITMDADLQDLPEELPDLYKMLQSGYDLVSGWKKKRYDPISKTIPTKLFNFTVRSIFKIPLHDFNSGIKAYRREVAQAIPLYGERHRYIPLLAYRIGFTEIGEKVVKHQKRQYGKTKYGWWRFINGFLDLISIILVTYFIKKPMHFFGTIGIFSFLTGSVFTVSIVAEKLYKSYYHLPFRQPTEQPLFYLALVALIIGVQLFLTGLIGEILISQKQNPQKDYRIKEFLHSEIQNREQT